VPQRVTPVDSLHARRLKAAGLFRQGHSQAEVARRCQVSAVTAMRWHRAFEHGGVTGLAPKGPRGRRPRVTSAQLQKIEQALLQGALEHGYRTDLWTLPRVAKIIEKLTGVSYHPGHVWRILRRMNWSPQRPTTRARERDDAAVERWIRGRWPRIKRGRKPEPRSSF